MIRLAAAASPKAAARLRRDGGQPLLSNHRNSILLLRATPRSVRLGKFSAAPCLGATAPPRSTSS